MPRLLYSASASVDGYTADTSGSFDWAAPDEEVHAFVNELERGTSTYLYGRRMYETMQVWQTFGDDPGESPVVVDFAGIWRGADKIVYSATLDAVSTPRTSLERTFDPDAVRAIVDAAPGDVGIGGPTIAAAALRAGLVDEVRLILVPVAVGGGTPALPRGLRLGLDLLDERRFGNGTVFLNYRVTRS